MVALDGPEVRLLKYAIFPLICLILVLMWRGGRSYFDTSIDDVFRVIIKLIMTLLVLGVYFWALRMESKRVAKH